MPHSSRFSAAEADTFGRVGVFYLLAMLLAAVISAPLFPIAPVSWMLALIACVFAITCPGCATHRALSKHTIAANLTTADIYYQQVLSNVARFEANPASMPSFAVISSGTVNVQDNQQASISPTYSPTLTFMQQGGGALPILRCSSDLAQAAH
jgi:hypothetical protein